MKWPCVFGFVTAMAVLATPLLPHTAAADPSPSEAPPAVYLSPARSAPALSSAALTQRAWKALETGQYDEALFLADEIVLRFAAMADRQQQRLREFAPPDRAAQYGALNDVGTALFIKGRAYRLLSRATDARQMYLEIMQNYRFAQCWDLKGWFWKVAEAAQDEIHSMEYGVDYGDYTSETLTSQAWKALQARKQDAVEMYTRKCIELYAETAMRMQSELNDFAPKGVENDYWALNDVATCLLIRGKSFQQQRRNREAAKMFTEIIEKYPYAVCWNPNGHFWRVAEAAQRSLSVYSP